MVCHPNGNVGALLGKGLPMIRGIGVDNCCISEIGRVRKATPAFVERTFSAAERAAAPRFSKQTAATENLTNEYYAVRFAVKEAVFKALAHHTPEKGFDFRRVESANHEDGAPYVVVTPWLQEIMDKAGVGALHVSATTENDLATAFVVAEAHK